MKLGTSPITKFRLERHTDLGKAYENKQLCSESINYLESNSKYTQGLSHLSTVLGNIVQHWVVQHRGHRIIESLRSEKTFRIIKSNYQHSTTTMLTTKPQVSSAAIVFFEHSPGMRLPGDWIWKEWEEVQAMSPQDMSEGRDPGGCNGTYPLPMPGTACSASDFTYKGLFSPMILRIILYLLLTYFLPYEIVDCWSHWSLWMMPLGTQGLQFTGNLDLTNSGFKRPWDSGSAMRSLFYCGTFR